MAPTNRALRDAAISHAIGIRRLSSGVVNEIISLLNSADADLLDKIADIDPAKSYTRASLLKRLAGIRTLNRDVYKDLSAAMKRTMRDIAKYEGSFQARQSAKIGLGFGVFEVPSSSLLVAAAMENPFQGKYLSEWVEGMEAGRFMRLRDAIRIGIVQGETTNDIVKRIRGTREQNYKDGILEISRRSATAMVRTAVGHTVEAAKDAVYQQNTDVIEGWRWVATLDPRTCATCADLDGEEFPVGEGPDIPAHINCRCASSPVVKGGGGFDRITYDKWIAEQPEDVQDEALGPSRAALYREGGLKIDQFVDDLRRPLTLSQLEQIEPRAFEDAGLVEDVGFEFVSPNVGELTFEEAVGELGSDRQIALRAAASEVDDAVGLRTRDSNIIGAWADGAENSVLSRISSLAGDPDESWDKLQASAAMKGYLADQKSVLVFRQDDEGGSFMHSFNAEGALKDIHQNLLDDGVQFHTLVPTETGAKVYVVDMDRSAHDAVEKAAERYDAEIEVKRGQAEFLGTQKQDGTDEEQRADARRVYEEIIGQSPVPEIQGAWDRLRDRWSETLGVADATKIDESSVDAKTFKRWFGKSKVVDDSDEPLKVYHGSGRKGIDVFDPALTGSVETSDWGKGVYFTPSRSTADFYREAAVKATDPEDARLWAEYEAEAKRLGTTPMMSGIDLGIDSEEYKQLGEFEARWRAHREELGRNQNLGEVYEAYLKIENPMVYQYEGITDPYLAEQAISKGHDGLFIVGDYEDAGKSAKHVEEIIVFKPEQIKIAADVEQPKEEEKK